MNKKIRYISFRNNEFLYLLSFFIISFFKTLGLGSNDNFYRIFMAISIFICLTKFFMDLQSGISKKTIFYLSFLFIILFINYLITYDITFLVTFIFFISIKNVSLLKIFKTILFAKLLGFFTNIFLVLSGIKEVEVIYFYRDEFIERNAFGFGHPNFLHYIFFSIVILIITIYRRKISIMHILFILMLNYLIYTLSASRTGFFNVIILCVIFIFLENKVMKKFIFFITKYIQIFFVCITYFFAKYLYEVEFINLLDKYLTGRIYYSHIQINNGLSLFGNNFINTSVIFDNSYSMLISYYGILILITCMYMYVHTVNKLIEKKLDILLIFMLVFSISLFAESYYPSIIINLTLLIIAKIFFGEIDDVKNEFS